MLRFHVCRLSTATLDSFGFKSNPSYIWAGLLYCGGLWLLTTFVTGIILDKVTILVFKL